jgi:nitrate reductase gamma subunit
VATTIMALLGAAFLIGLFRIVRRFTLPHLRLISSPDDYFAVIMLTGWFLSGLLAQAHVLGWLRSELFLVAFLLATSFFLIYVPFSKISHYLYYPFTRYWLGRSLGHRGSMPYARG